MNRKYKMKSIKKKWLTYQKIIRKIILFKLTDLQKYLISQIIFRSNLQTILHIVYNKAKPKKIVLNKNIMK